NFWNIKNDLKKNKLDSLGQSPLAKKNVKQLIINDGFEKNWLKGTVPFSQFVINYYVFVTYF
ncbi:MAG: hypothetical protein Q4B68_10745, partial [Bacteroidales bacterium]|nr:hypothetical protein [Bacteroidales bacterium]